MTVNEFKYFHELLSGQYPEAVWVYNNKILKKEKDAFKEFYSGEIEAMEICEGLGYYEDEDTIKIVFREIPGRELFKVIIIWDWC